MTVQTITINIGNQVLQWSETDSPPINGYVIYNSTTNKFQGYAGGSWVDLH